MPLFDLSKSLLVPKPSKYEYDLARLGLTHETLLGHYRRENADRILESHRRQRGMRARARALLPEARLVERERVTASDVRAASLVVSLGGDNHFIYLSHLCVETPLLGIKSDSLRSHGGLLPVDEANLDEAVASLREGRVAVERWTRIEARVDGAEAPPAASEIFLGEERRRDISRHVLVPPGLPDTGGEEQKGSGLLVTTGAGSTGFAGCYLAPFDRQAPEARWVLTEPFPRNTAYRAREGTLRRGETLTVRSRNDASGVLTCDCLKDIPFPYAAVATVRLSDRPLNVVRPAT
ncbi:MAG: hypothetical protein HY608_05985 [Planctomycetes bacterium]|nr:hypothetical protein [Planctomycetota bacterium]